MQIQHDQTVKAPSSAYLKLSAMLDNLEQQFAQLKETGEKKKAKEKSLVLAE